MANRIIWYDPKLKELARKLRKESTLSEILLWKEIKGRKLGIEFHRQVPVDRYIVDFFCHELSLAIEIDGITHYDDLALQKDDARQARLESLGIYIIRFADRDVKVNIRNVIRTLEDKIERLNSN